MILKQIALQSRQKAERERICKKSVFDNSLTPKSISLKAIDYSKLFDARHTFELNKNIDSNTDNKDIGVKVIDKTTDKNAINSLVAYNSSDSE